METLFDNIYIFYFGLILLILGIIASIFSFEKLKTLHRKEIQLYQLQYQELINYIGEFQNNLKKDLDRIQEEKLKKN